MAAKYTAPRHLADAILAANDRDELLALIRQLPGVTYAASLEHDHRIDIRATGTRCGDLSRPYGYGFLLDAFGIEHEPEPNEALDEAIERAQALNQARRDEIERDGFDRAVDRTITWKGFVAEVEPHGYGEIAVTVAATLKDGSSRRLGQAILMPQKTRREVVEAALARLGYERTLQADEDHAFTGYYPNGRYARLLKEMGR